MKRWPGWAFVALWLVGCDGDGSYGGPNGPATKFCQRALQSYDAGPLAGACAGCCIQEVKYRGVIEDGRCVCR